MISIKSLFSLESTASQEIVELTENIEGGIPDKKPVSKLLLDEGNPRFGDLGRKAEQSQLVDMIITRFGIDDVLNSLALNGFFQAEPLVCMRRQDGRLIVKEGNRRLVACIVLACDKRGDRQDKLRTKARERWESSGRNAIEPIPILIFDEDGNDAEKLHSYLGVRHISGAQAWDSYAKAAWVAQITDSTGTPVSKISEMIGDQHGTVIRLLEGYRFVRQLIEEGKFRPENSNRSGRGSVSEYPFSWIYTILGFKAVRNFCGLEEITGKRNPLPNEHLDHAALVVETMFGNKLIGRSSALIDSRQLKDLASAFSDPDKVAELKTGKDLITVLELTKPIEEKLEQNLAQARNLLSNLVSSLSESPPSAEIAQRHLKTAAKTRILAADIWKRLNEIVQDQFEDDDF